MIEKPGDFLHYRTDTAPGSSGAPVFNDQWQVVALHRAGVWATNDAGQILAIDGSDIFRFCNAAGRQPATHFLPHLFFGRAGDLLPQ